MDENVKANLSGQHLISYISTFPISVLNSLFRHSVQYTIIQNLEGLSRFPRTRNPLEKRNKADDMKKQLNKEATWLALKAVADVDIYGHLKTC